ncbi:MAG: FAD-dependent oxidoreductase, partial [Phycisphaerae bacterium]|nr:FAD-dependent oxidoreductase [Phycisphaerae bacterium]
MRDIVRRGCLVMVAGMLLVSSNLPDVSAARDQGGLSTVVHESARDIPVAYEVDVLVVGGASRAVAAAVSAASQGARVFLAAPHVYLGEDLCSTYRLWLDPCEVPVTSLAAALYAEPPVAPSYGENALAFSYSADMPSASPHPDNASQSLLRDGKWMSAPSQSVQYNGDVTLSADLGQTQYVEQASVLVYQRPGDFEVTEVGLEVSVDGQDWDSAGVIRNDQLGQGFEQQALALCAKIERSVRYVRFLVRRAPGTERVLLGEILIEGKAQAAPPKSRYPVPPKPMQVKRVLDQALLDASVQFLYGCCPTEVLCDAQGELAGIVVANRSGRQAIKAKVIIDATPMATVARVAGVTFERRDALPCRFQRIVVGGDPTIFSPQVVRKMPSLVSGHDGRMYEAYEYTFTRPWDGRSFAELARIEQAGRDLTWQRGQVDASERLFFIPPERIVSPGPPCRTWPGALKADGSLFKPESVKRLYVLNGSAHVSTAVAAQILRPIEAMQIGERLGRMAAAEAKGLDSLAGVFVRSKVSQDAAAAGDIGDDPAWAPPQGQQLGTVHSPARSVPVLGSYDVVVVGGGTGGAPAGIAAARQGARTLVVETLHGLGGIGTMGMISKYYHGFRKGFTEEIDAG